MKCPRCGKNLMTKEEQEKWGYCSDCFSEEWSKKLDERILEDIDTHIQQAKNLQKIYEDYEQNYGGYADAVDHYKKYVEKLIKLKEDNK